MRLGLTVLGGCFSALVLSGTVVAEDENALSNLWKEGKPIVDSRLRYETVDQEGFAENAHAVTLRTRLGFETGQVHDTKVLIELENVVAIGDEDFNSTTNGNIARPVIADPDITEVNRAQIEYTGLPDTKITAGRQRIVLNNARFIGDVVFRQNQQTYDAVRVENNSLPITLNYIYIGRTHRILGDDNAVGDFVGDSHVVQADAALGPFGNVSIYGLALQLEELQANSTVTTGIRATGDHRISRRLALSHEVEYARQWDYDSNPLDYAVNYYHAAVGARTKHLSAKAGYEVLGGDGAIGFSTPLATLHKFQGLADAFLVTPAGGIKDFYARIGARTRDIPFGQRLSGSITYHDFESEEFDAGLGHEVDARVDLTVDKNWSVHLQGALYEDGNTGPASRNKFWAAARFRY